MTGPIDGRDWVRSLGGVAQGDPGERGRLDPDAIVAGAARVRLRRRVGLAVGAVGLLALVGLGVRESARATRVSAEEVRFSAPAVSGPARPVQTATDRSRRAGSARVPLADSQPAEPPEANAAAEPEGAPVQAVPRVAAVKRSPPPVPAWKRALERGDHAGALAAMNAADWDAFVEAASSLDLLSMARVARAERDPSRASAALASVRRRFPRTAAAGQATFLLGRVTLELERDAVGARRWFQTYVDQFPNGPLAGQAWGRLLKSAVDAGDDPDARRAAQAYLRVAPEGPYRDLAHRVVSPD